MRNQFGPSSLYTEDYNKEVGKIIYYAFGAHIQSTSNVHGKSLVM